MASFRCPSGCGLRARRDGSCAAVACTNYRPSMRGACRTNNMPPKRLLSTCGSPSFKATSRRIRAKLTHAAASTPVGSPLPPGLLGQLPLVPPVDESHLHPSMPVAASADVAAAVATPIVAIAAAAAPGDSRARLRCAVLARLSSLSSEVGEPSAFHIMGACLAVVDKSPHAARLEPMSLWASAVLQVGWALMGSSATVAPDRVWRSSEPRLVQKAAITVVMNWVGGCSVSLPFVQRQA